MPTAFIQTITVINFPLSADVNVAPYFLPFSVSTLDILC